MIADYAGERSGSIAGAEGCGAHAAAIIENGAGSRKGIEGLAPCVEIEGAARQRNSGGIVNLITAGACELHRGARNREGSTADRMDIGIAGFSKHHGPGTCRHAKAHVIDRSRQRQGIVADFGKRVLDIARKRHIARASHRVRRRDRRADITGKAGWGGAAVDKSAGTADSRAVEVERNRANCLTVEVECCPRASNIRTVSTKGLPVGELKDARADRDAPGEAAVIGAQGHRACSHLCQHEAAVECAAESHIARTANVGVVCQGDRPGESGSGAAAVDQGASAANPRAIQGDWNCTDSLSVQIDCRAGTGNCDIESGAEGRRIAELQSTGSDGEGASKSAVVSA